MAAAGWYPDPTRRAELRWFDGTSWSEHVSTRGRQGVDPLPSSAVDPATAELVDRVLASALGFADLVEVAPVDPATIQAGLWRDATGRRDVLQLAEGHLAGLEARGSTPPRARALGFVRAALG